LQKISDKRKIGDCCIPLLKNAENEKKRLNLASEWRLFDSQSKMKKSPTQKRRNPQNDIFSILIWCKKDM
jgi:hypothetical protein